MLIETPLAPLLDERDTRPADLHRPIDPRDEQLVRDAAAAAREDHRALRIQAAMDTLDELARRRRTQELLLAVDRLGAGLDTTMTALDAAVDSLAARRDALEAAAPQSAAPGLAPISTPVVPIVAAVHAPALLGQTRRQAPAVRS